MAFVPSWSVNLFHETVIIRSTTYGIFYDAARALGEVKDIHGAHWELEIGALTELFAFKEPSPLVLFDQVPGYAANFRISQLNQYAIGFVRDRG